MTKSMVQTWVEAELVTDERGASMVEYAFLVALIATVCIAALLFLGTELNAKYADIGTSLS
jgi:pilus assembly protein Flp/PilA